MMKECTKRHKERVLHTHNCKPRILFDPHNVYLKQIFVFRLKNNSKHQSY